MKDLWVGLGLIAGSVFAAKLFGGSGLRYSSSSSSSSSTSTSTSTGFERGAPVIIGVYALGDGVPWWPDQKPRTIYWPGVKATPTSHPSWGAVAQALRDPAGRILPNLLAKYNMSDASKVAVVAFSAGSASGLRELLRHPADRAQIDFVASIDGIHVYAAPEKDYNPANPMSFFKFPDLPGEVNGYRDFMLQAARGQKGAVFTGSNVAAPVVEGDGPFTKSRLAITALLRSIGMQLGRLGAGDTPWDSPPLRAASGDQPLSPATQAALRSQLGTVVTSTVGGLRAVAAPNGSDAAAHIAQANAIPTLLLNTLVPRWKSGGWV